jgi:hypothetical protein
MKVKFQELTDKAKQEVITRLAPDCGWWDSVYESATEGGVAKGFRIDDISFSGFWSQGDGASWEGLVDIAKWLELNRAHDPHTTVLIELIEDGWLSEQLSIIRSNSRYSHSYTMNHDGWDCVAPSYDSVITKGILKGAKVQALLDAMGAGQLDDVLVGIMTDARDYADDIYRQLEKEYDWLCSEEVIAELCDANEYLFTEDGKHFV